MDNKFLFVTCKWEHLKCFMKKWRFDLKLLFQTYTILKLVLHLKFDLLVFFP